MSHNFQLVNADTDSITICKLDGTSFSEDEQEHLLKELNSLFPESIKWEDDGYYKKVIVLKAKNYILVEQNGKIKYKGSAIKATQKEPALKEFIKEIVNSLINNKNDYTEIYHKYIKEACNVKDIKRWSTRKTISDRTLESERSNESRIRDAIEGTEIVEGDRCYLFFKDDKTLELAERFDGTYSLDKLLNKLYDTSWTFESILDCEMLFKNYKLKRNKGELNELLSKM